MTEDIAPPANEEDATYAAMKDLLDDAQVVKSAHFIAKERKNQKSKIIGVSVIVLNLLITSGLIEVTIANQDKITIAIKLVSFLAAALAGIQTIFNFQKEIECHINAGDVYSSINRRTKTVMAEYHDEPTQRDARITDFKALEAEYLKANEDSKTCVPTNKDYEKARPGIDGRSGKRARRRATQR